MEPAFKRMDEKLLSQYIIENLLLDLRTDINRHDLLASLHYMTGLEVTSGYFNTAMDKLYYSEPYIIDGHEKIYGEESIFNFIKALVEVQASGPMFNEFIKEKNGIIPEVECLRIEFIDDTVTQLNQKPLAN